MEDKKPRFSIIVPIYNVEEYLSECIDSVLQQTYKDFECVLVDDGSTDQSSIIAQRYVEKDKRFKLLHQENQGLSGARNTGIKNCTGQYSVFLDSDDFITKDALQNLSEIIMQKEPDIIVSSSIAYYEDAKQLIPREWNPPQSFREPGEVLEAIARTKTFVLAAWCIVVKNDYLKKNNLFFYPGLKHEDELWVPQAVINAPKIAINKAPFYCGRCDRVGSITQSMNIQKLFDKLFIIDKLVEFSIFQKGINKQAVQMRCSQIMTGIIKDLQKYKTNNSYKELLMETKKRLYVLKFGNGTKYDILHILCKLCGVSLISKLWGLKQ